MKKGCLITSSQIGLAFEPNPSPDGDGSNVFYFEGNYSEYEANKAMRLGIEEPKRARYRKLMEE